MGKERVSQVTGAGSAVIAVQFPGGDSGAAAAVVSLVVVVPMAVGVSLGGEDEAGKGSNF